MPLNREAFLAASVLGRVTVTIPGRGEIIVRELTGLEVAEFVRLQKAGKETEAMSHVIISTLRGENDEPLLKPDEKDVAAKLPATVVNTILDAALDLSGLKEKKAN